MFYAYKTKKDQHDDNSQIVFKCRPTILVS